MRNRTALLVAVSITLPACGNMTPPPRPTAVAPPLAPVTFAGSYTGTAMTFTDAGGAGTLSGVTGRTTVTQNGSSLNFSNLVLTHPAGLATTFGMGTATLGAGDRFTGSGSYSSSGCGVMSVTFAEWFAGNFMNLQATLTPSSSRCALSDIRGEMRRP